jgi:nitroreductase
MLLDDAINQRYSVRAFTNQPVDRQLVAEILELAVRSPSWGNTQPWEIAVAGGKTAAGLTQAFAEKVMAGVPGNPDFVMPEKFSGVFMDRYRDVGKEVFRVKNIAREDQAARLEHVIANFRGFGAPNLIYLTIDQCLTSVYSVFDCGLLAAHICLLAASRGLGTCLLAALTMYPDLTRQYLNLPPEKKVVLGLALGYPDEQAPVNRMRTPREVAANNVKLVDMD